METLEWVLMWIAGFLVGSGVTMWLLTSGQLGWASC